MSLSGECVFAPSVQPAIAPLRTAASCLLILLCPVDSTSGSDWRDVVVRNSLTGAVFPVVKHAFDLVGPD